MSLKAFHFVFIIASILLAFGFGAWLVKQFFSPEGHAWHLVSAILSVATGIALIFYERYFLKKTRSLSYL